MDQTVGPEDHAAFAAIVHALEVAWNTADAAAFGAPFALDADFVDIRADHHRGRETIVAGHAAVLETIYAGSTNHYSVEAARLLRPDVAVVHVQSALDAPSGPLAGHHTALFSLVLTREPSGWQIATFPNTLAPPPRAP